MSNYPKVSVVTITYGHEQYITQTLDGVLMQKYPGEIEFIIANDCSPDRTDAVVKEYLSKVKIPLNIKINYTKHEVNKGMMPNFNWALEQAQGKYIAVCEGDDYWIDPLKLQKQVDFMEKNPKYILCFHQINYLNNETGDIEKTYPNGLTKSSFSQEDIAKGNFIPTPSILFRNPETDFPNFDEIMIGDYPLYLFLSSKGQVKFLDFIGATYRFGVGVFSTQHKINQQIEAKRMLDAVLEKDFLNDDSRKLLIKQKLYYGKNIFKKDKNPNKYKNLIRAKDIFTNYTLSQRFQIFVKSLF